MEHGLNNDLNRILTNEITVSIVKPKKREREHHKPINYTNKIDELVIKLDKIDEINIKLDKIISLLEESNKPPLIHANRKSINKQSKY